MRTATTTALLDGLIDSANDQAWREFDARYRPIIVSFARALDLKVEDAADVAQETLVRFLKEYRAGKYDRSRGRLHSWLIGIAKHCVGDQRHARARRREQRGLSAIADLPGDHRLTEIWDYERYGTPWRKGKRTFFSKNDGLQDQSVYYVQDTPDGEPRVLLDPNTLREDGTVDLGGMSVSEDGR